MYPKHRIVIALLMAAPVLACSGHDEGVREPSETVGKTKNAILSASARSYASLSVGDSHSCAIGDDGKVHCGGTNVDGQIGNGSTASHFTTGQITSLSQRATVVSAYTYHGCAASVYGMVWCWGDNTAGQLGNGTFTSTTSPVRAGTLTNATSVGTGMFHSCAVLASPGTGTGNVVCWGDNSVGQLGDGTNTTRTSPVYVSHDNVTDIALGDFHTCALDANGTVWCWGKNTSGQLGDGTTTDSNIPVQVSGIAGAKAIAALGSSTCALLRDGTVKCWGANTYGQLGDGTTTMRTSPVSVLKPTGTNPLDEVIAIGSGVYHACAVTTGSGTYCWGYNAAGQLGDGTSVNQSRPTLVLGLSNAIAIDGGWAHTCATQLDGTVRCWGDNSSGQLGNGTTTSSTSPVLANVGASVHHQLLLSVGAKHVCALASGYTQPRCWGDNDFGQIGDGTTVDRPSPVAAGADKRVAALSTGGTQHHTCQVTVDGDVYCWGYNGDGQVGDGTTIDRASPVQVNGIDDAIAVSTGVTHTCVLLSTGRIKCWGSNESGELGNDDWPNSSSTPVDVVGIDDAVAIALGGFHSCALVREGKVKCWGLNSSGQIGDGTTTRRAVPTDVTGITQPVVGITGGSYFTCALLANGRAKCWGSNASGQLGNGTTTSSSVPVDVDPLSLSDAVAIGSGDYHACAVLANGGVKCWGENGNGQLGDGTTTDRWKPVWSGQLNEVVRVSGGIRSTCVVRAYNQVWCWGDNTDGQLGNGTTTSSLWPVQVIGF